MKRNASVLSLCKRRQSTDVHKNCTLVLDLKVGFINTSILIYKAPSPAEYKAYQYLY